MQIVINNNFYKKLSPSHRRKAEEAINRLISLEKEGQLLAYLQAQNSKKLKGSEGTRFKYKVSASNRISFFYADNGSNQSSNCIILERYIHDHDDQSRVGKTKIDHGNMENTKILNPKNIGAIIEIDEDQSNYFDAKNRLICSVVKIKENDLDREPADFDIKDSTQEEREVYLSPEQREILNKCNSKAPLFLGGCAGSVE